MDKIGIFIRIDSYFTDDLSLWHNNCQESIRAELVHRLKSF